MSTNIMSSTIYVGRPGLIGLRDTVDHADIDMALAKAAQTATEITILGGFYSLQPLIILLKAVPRRRRPKCRVRVAVGLEATALIPRTWGDMRQLRETLTRLGFKKPEIAIVDSAPVHFHTKLFRFVNRTRPVWFVGSANPGSGRHELMVRIPGRHQALSDNVTAVFRKAVPVQRHPKPSSITTLRDFFLDGLLCHRPPVQRLFTFEAFQFDPSHRARLSSALAGSSGVDHASPKAQGFGFELRSALGLARAADDIGTASRTHYRPYSIDTVLGWWMPQSYADEIRKVVRKTETKREARLAKIGAALRSPTGQAMARKALKDHVASMQAFLDLHSIDARPAADRDARFEKLLRSRTRMLANDASLSRHARSLTLTDMPDIWADGSAVKSFQGSFFDDLAYRSVANPQASIVRSLLEWLDDEDLSDADDFEKAMADRLVAEPWSDQLWY